MISQQQIEDGLRVKALHGKRRFLLSMLGKAEMDALNGRRVEGRRIFIRRHLRRVNAELKHGPGAYDRFLAYMATALPIADGARKRAESPLIRYMTITF